MKGTFISKSNTKTKVREQTQRSSRRTKYCKDIPYNCQISMHNLSVTICSQKPALKKLTYTIPMTDGFPVEYY